MEDSQGYNSGTMTTSNVPAVLAPAVGRGLIPFIRPGFMERLGEHKRKLRKRKKKHGKTNEKS